MKNTEVKNKKLSGALLRCVAALALSALLLAATGFSVFSLIEGPTETSDIQTEEQGAFVYRDVFSILGFYAEDAAGDEVQGRYALVPMGGKLVTVRFTDRYLESAAAVCDNTYDYINGRVDSLSKYVTVQGTVGELSEAESAIMYDWFGLNREQLIEMGVITDTDDYADYLTDTALLVDTVDGYDQTLVIVLAVISALLLVYMIVELVLMGTGYYLPERQEARARAKSGGAAAGDEAEADVSSAGEPGTDESGEPEAVEADEADEAETETEPAETETEAVPEPEAADADSGEPGEGEAEPGDEVSEAVEAEAAVETETDRPEVAE